MIDENEDKIQIANKKGFGDEYLVTNYDSGHIVVTNSTHHHIIYANNTVKE